MQFSQEVDGEITSNVRRTKDVEVTYPSEREDTEHLGFIEGLKCKGDCSICEYCKVHHGQTVYVEYH